MVGGPSWGCAGLLPCSALSVTLSWASSLFFTVSPIFSIIPLSWISFASCFPCRSLTCFFHHFLFPNHHLSGPLNSVHPVTMSISYFSLGSFYLSSLWFHMDVTFSDFHYQSSALILKINFCLSFQFPIFSTSLFSLYPQQHFSYLDTRKRCFLYLPTLSLPLLSVQCSHSFCPLSIQCTTARLVVSYFSFHSFLTLDLEPSLSHLFPWWH